MNSHHNNQTNTSNTEVQNSALVKDEVKPGLSLEGDLQLPDYITKGPISPKGVDELANWTSKEREKTRTNIAMWLVRMLVGSTAATGLLIGLAVFNPNADKAFIKEMIPLVLTPQATLLGVATGYYFGAAKEK